MNLEWERIQPTEKISVGDYRKMVKKNFILPDGTEREFIIKEPEGSISVAVIAFTPDKQIVIAKQYRPGPERIMYELPGGGANPGEDSAQSALRELEEETGYTSDKIELLGEVYRDAYTNTVWHYFVAYDCYETGNGQALDATEFIETVLVSRSDLFEYARSGYVTDTSALFLAYDILKKE